MTRIKFALVAAFVAALPVSVAAQDTFQIPVDAKFFDANMRWTGANAGGYDAKMKLIVNKQGHLSLCGIGRVTNIQLSSAIKSGVRGGRLFVDGKPVIKGFGFFTKAKNAADLKKGNATCKSSGVKPPRSGDDIDIRYGKATFRN